MLDEVEINKLIEELNSVKSELRDLRNKYNSIDRKKEDLFREKRKISSDIFSRIKDAKGAKDKRNSLTSVVKNSKLSKEELVQRIHVLDIEINTLKEDRRKILDKVGVADPQMLRKSIKQLEFKIETEGLTFEKEKELMKVLSKMKKQYESTKGIADIEHKLDGHFRELRDLREQEDMTRKIVQVSAKESQKHHIEMVESSKEIDELKEKESGLEVEIGKFKAELHDIGTELDAKNVRIDELKKVLNENNVKFKEDVQRANNEILQQKNVEVQDKLKKGKKLTTEDLLILQRTMKN